MNEFDELLKALNAIQPEKAPAVGAAQGGEDDEHEEEDDAAIAAAAAAAEAAKKGGEGKPTMTKSFEFVDAEGNAHEGVDATDLVKSLIAGQEASAKKNEEFFKSVTAVMVKQTDLIKSLQEQVNALSKQGGGRKSMLTVVEKPDAGTVLQKGGESGGLSTEEFFAKANAAFDAGKLTGKDLNTVSVCLRMGHPVDPQIVKNVLTATGGKV